MSECEKNKYCYQCRQILPTTEFHRNKAKLDGYADGCKVCVRKRVQEYRMKYPDKVRESKRRARVNNPEKERARVSRYKQRHPERRRAICAAYNARFRTEHRDVVNARNNMRRAMKRNAVPKWANKDHIDGIYELCAMLRNLGLDFDIDHIVPLKSDVVCGLHVENNLQILASLENQRKGNRYWPDMP